MDDNNRQPWLLIAIAALGLALGVIALIVAFNAKSASDDAASQQSVNQVQTELSNLVDKLGIAESTLAGEQKNLQGKANRAAKQSQDAVTNVSSRLDKLEKQTAALKSNNKQTATLQKQVASLTQQVGALENRVTSTNARVTSLTQKVNKLSRELNSADGAQSAP